MPFGIELLFDSKTESAVRGMWRLLDRKHIPTPLGKDNPHVTLAAFQNTDLPKLTKDCRRIARLFPSIPLSFESIGSFPGQGVLFLAPVVTRELLRLHSRIHRTLKGNMRKHSRYYTPEIWVPHCTLSMTPLPQGLFKSFEAMRQINIAMTGRLNRLEIVEYRTRKKGFSTRLRTVLEAPLSSPRS